MSGEIARLLQHLAWADERTLDSVRGAGRPAAAVELYAHILAAEHLWLARIRHQSASFPVWPGLSLEECGALAKENHAGYTRLLDELPAAELTREVAYTNSAGQSFRSRIDDILLHVCLHGAYHRGQVAMLVRGAGAQPATTDYIALVRGAPAATRPNS